MVFDRLRWRLALGLGAVFFLFAAAAALAAREMWPAASGLALAALLAAVLLWRGLARAIRAAAEMVEALRHGDYQMRSPVASGPRELRSLARALESAARRFAHDRQRMMEELHLQQALVRHAPVPLFLAEGTGAFRPINGAGRRLLDALAPPSGPVLPDPLAEQLAQLAPGARKTVRVAIGDRDETFEAHLAVVQSEARRVRLLALQPLSHSLEAAEIAAWQKLFQVLAHEIMNSLTPILSLSRTALERLPAHPESGRDGGLSGRADEGTDGGTDGETAVAEVREALETVTRRAEGLKRFVEAYRQLARPPRVQRRPVAVGALLARIEQLVAPALSQRRITISWRCTPRNLSLVADPELIEQVLLNLIWNARDALAGRSDGRILLDAALSRGGRVVIAVADNGPGVPEADRERIFLPFYSTKPRGEGIGLALVRQIMVAHGGRVSYRAGEQGGARFVLTF